MKVSRLAPWILAAILASTACHGPETEVQQEPPTTTEVEQQPSTTAKAEGQPTTTKIEECSWCPASDTSGTTAAQQPASPQPDLIDRLQSATGGTAFADISEDELLADISEVCKSWAGDNSLEDATATVSLTRAELLGVTESEPGLAAYTQVLETSAAQRCVRDPLR